MPEKLNLGWENFSEHQLLFLKYLYQEGQYADVTLVSDDQTQFKAQSFQEDHCQQSKSTSSERKVIYSHI